MFLICVSRCAVPAKAEFRENIKLCIFSQIWGFVMLWTHRRYFSLSVILPFNIAIHAAKGHCSWSFYVSCYFHTLSSTKWKEEWAKAQTWIVRRWCHIHPSAFSLQSARLFAHITLKKGTVALMGKTNKTQ